MSLNKVLLIGYVGKDPDVRYFDSGSAIANFSLATSERGYKLANGTEVPERTEWHNIVVRREQVSFVEKWVKKGASVYIEGKIRTRTYDDQAGVKRYVTEIYADKIEFFNIGTRSADASATHVPASSVTTLVSPVTPPLDSTTNEADDLPF
jgi:single-strand DNA-binding protein